MPSLCGVILYSGDGSVFFILCNICFLGEILVSGFALFYLYHGMYWSEKGRSKMMTEGTTA